MALIPCPSCKQDVSTSAKACPHCGCRTNIKNIPQKLTATIWLTIAAIVLDIAFKVSIHTAEYISGMSFGLLVLSFIFLSVSWLIWFSFNFRPAFICGMVINVIIIVSIVLGLLQLGLGMYSYLSFIFPQLFLLSSPLIIAQGVILLFLPNKGKLKKLIVTVGVLYIMFNLWLYVEPHIELERHYDNITHTWKNAMDSPIYLGCKYIIQYGSLIMTVVLFRATKKSLQR